MGRIPGRSSPSARRAAIIAGLLLLRASQLWASGEPPRHSLAVGAIYKGAQVHLGLGARWAVEARTQGGNAGSDVGRIDASSYGARLYHYFRAPSRLRLLIGAEGAATRSTASQVNYKATGTAVGAFIGAEIYAARRLSFNVD